MFMPGQQLVNLFPARRRRPKPAEEPVWLEDGESNWDQWGGIQSYREEAGGPNTDDTDEEIGQKQISSPLPEGV